MALKEPIVIDNFHKGIAESVLTGFNEVVACETETYKGCLMAGYKSTRTSTTKNIVNTTITGVNISTNSISLSDYLSTDTSEIFLIINITAGTPPTGLSLNTDYYLRRSSGSTYVVYATYSAAYNSGTSIDITGTQTGATVVLITPSEIRHVAKVGTRTFLMDSTGRIWYEAYSGAILNIVDGNNISSYPGKGLIVYKGYLLAFNGSSVDALSILTYNDGDAISWSNGCFNPSVGGGFQNLKNPILGSDDTVYWLNRDISNDIWSIGSIYQKDGQVFDPTSSSTYTLNTNALDLPEDPTCLEQLNKDLLIGTDSGKIFKWDRVSSTFFLPLDIKTKNIRKLLNVNNLVYIFSNSNSIFVTNGTSTDILFTMPNHTINFPTNNPYLGGQSYAYGAEYSFGKLYFISKTSYGYSGIYSINIKSGEFKEEVVYTQAGTSSVNTHALWFNSSNGFLSYSYDYYLAPVGTTYAVESAIANSGYYYQTFVPYIITAFYKVGSTYNKHTFQYIELEFLDTINPSSTYGAKVYWRENKSDTWTLITDLIGLETMKSYLIDFAESVESIQFKIMLSGNSTKSPILKSLIAQ